MDIQTIEQMRDKINQLWDKMTLEDFKRVHAKFFGALISIETGFKKKFPEEWKIYEMDFYGEK